MRFPNFGIFRKSIESKRDITVAEAVTTGTPISGFMKSGIKPINENIQRIRGCDKYIPKLYFEIKVIILQDLFLNLREIKT